MSDDWVDEHWVHTAGSHQEGYDAGRVELLARVAELRVDLLAAEEQIAQLRGDLRALRCGADAEFQAALADAVVERLRAVPAPRLRLPGKS